MNNGTPDLMAQLAAVYGGHIPGMPANPMMGMPSLPGPSIAPPIQTAAAPLNLDQISKLIDERINLKLAPVTQPITIPVEHTASPDASVNAGNPEMQKLVVFISLAEDLIKRSLSQEDYQSFANYVANGGKGFDELSKGDKLYPIVQMLWETIKENTK